MSLLHCCYHYHCWNWSVVIFFCTLFPFFKKKTKQKISLPSFNPPDCLAVHQQQNQGLSRLLQRPIQHHPIKYFFLDYPIVRSFFLLRPLCLLTLFFLSPSQINSTVTKVCCQQQRWHISGSGNFTKKSTLHSLALRLFPHSLLFSPLLLVTRKKR